MSKDLEEKYKPLFELGLYESNPAIKVVSECEVCPTVVAALVTALFETVMRSVSDEKQIEFEEKFNSSLIELMQKRFDYDVTIHYPENE